MRHLSRALVLVILLLCPLGAAAQTASQPVLPKWDAGASFGILWGDGFDFSQLDEYGEDAGAAYNLDLGRFWTDHFKTDFSVMLTNQRRDYEYGSFPVPGAPGAYQFTFNDHSVLGFSGAATYQFFENQMMHPYVSAGLQFGLAEQHRYREAQTYTVNRISYTVPAFDQRASSVLVRPFVAIGAKSYFNERTFVKSEFMTAVSSSGFSHALLRIGFGFDF